MQFLFGKTRKEAALRATGLAETISPTITVPPARPDPALTREIEELRRRCQRSDSRLAALDRVQAIIEFTPEGTILGANPAFLGLTGYTLEEVVGQHHGIFVDGQYRQSPDYGAFWSKLRRGEFEAGVYRRFGKGGREVWLQASYNPVFDEHGAVASVIKFATDITEQKRRDADAAGQLAAINRSQAVIEFELDGTIVTANDNFLAALGYTLGEIRGRHHSMFVEETYRSGPAYREFWARLNRGEYDTGEYLRIGKNGRHVWIHAFYNPVFDADGRVVKVVKFANDITAQKLLQDTIKRVLQDTSRVMGSLSAGKLDDHMAQDYTGEFAQLSASINGYIERLTSMVQEIRSAAGSVRNGAREIATGNTNLSQRTEQQASSLEETSAAMEEMTVTVQQNAANATRADTLAKTARETAIRGGDIVRRAVVAMEAINGSSRRIEDIIGVIDEIAFQTNLLALNAAVEAARAGDQGRGFAVVASEVRSLAVRSATAAKEIKELIRDSGEKVREGADLVNKSGESLDGIVTAVKQVSDVVTEIADASGEQSRGLDEINRAVMAMDEMTQQNAALVEEAAAASESLGEQAEILNGLIAFFELGQSEAPATRPRVGRPELRAVSRGT